MGVFASIASVVVWQTSQLWSGKQVSESDLVLNCTAPERLLDRWMLIIGSHFQSGNLSYILEDAALRRKLLGAEDY
eukprot:760847-Amphidinium_carterae.2